MTKVDNDSNTYVLQCMDIWSGNRATENYAQASGLEIYVNCQPYRGQSRGGDIHYVSLCAGGVLTRLILADVSGHGDAVSETSQNLRSHMRRYINTKRHDRLVHCLNREFTRLEQTGRFATAIIASYLSHRNRFTICNAGHPNPLWYQAEKKAWKFLNSELIETGRISNLPLGLDEAIEYQQFDLSVCDGDILVLYTDALTEASDSRGQLLGEVGLQRIVASAPTDDLRSFGNAIFDGVREFTTDHPVDDDATLLVIRFSKASPRVAGIAERLNGYARLIGLKRQ